MMTTVVCVFLFRVRNVFIALAWKLHGKIAPCLTFPLKRKPLFPFLYSLKRLFLVTFFLHLLRLFPICGPKISLALRRKAWASCIFNFRHLLLLPTLPTYPLWRPVILIKVIFFLPYLQKFCPLLQNQVSVSYVKKKTLKKSAIIT